MGLLLFAFILGTVLGLSNWFGFTDYFVLFYSGFLLFHLAFIYTVGIFILQRVSPISLGVYIYSGHFILQWVSPISWGVFIYTVGKFSSRFSLLCIGRFIYTAEILQ